MTLGERLLAHGSSAYRQVRRFFSQEGEPKRSFWLRYGVAFIAVALATLVRILFYYSGSQVPYLCFYPAVVLVALFLGVGPAVLTIALAAISTMFWLEPAGTFSITSAADTVGVVVFIATGALVVWVCERLRAARHRAEKAEETVRVLHRKETSELLENISDGFVSLDREWRFAYVNSAAVRMAHMPRDALIGRTLWEAYPKLENLPYGREYRRAMSDHVPVKVEGFYPEPINNWFEARCYPSAEGLSIFFSDVTERRQAQDALRREQDFNRALVENIVDAVVACDASFHLTLMNRAARQWHGTVDLSLPADRWTEFYGLYCADGITPMPMERVPLVRTFREETLRNEPMVIAAHGQPFRYVLCNGAPFFDEQGQKIGAVVVMHDVTERKLAEEELHRINRLYALLSQVNQAVIRCQTREELLQRICHATVDFGGFKMAWVGKIDLVSRQVIPLASTGDTEHYLENIKVYADDRPEGRGPIGRAIRSGESAISNNFAHDPEAVPWRDAATASGFRACIALPIRFQRKIFGTLAVYSGDLNYFHDKEIELLEEVATDVSFALDHLEQEIRRQQDEVALKQAKETAEAASRAKDQFIAVLSHELRTPLTPALTAITLMQTSREWQEEDREQIDMVRRNVELEAQLIDDLLDVTRISRGLIELRREEIDAHTCVRKALEICEAEIAAKGLRCDVSLKARNSLVWADPARLQQVFWNLIKNAVKFTPKGGQIAIRTANTGQRLKMEVSDTGIGIGPDVLPRIFNAFEQGEQTRSRQFGGLGLGLTIARNVVELHHGTLTAHSKGYNQGAVFIVELETALLAHQPPSAPVPEVAPRKDWQPRILLVEDHLDTLHILCRLLEKWGYFVRCADRVGKALDLAAHERFDLLISDIGLPDGNGLDVMRETRAIYGLRGIALSGFGTEEDLRQSRAAGFEEHLTKPVAPEALHAAVERLATQSLEEKT